MALDDNQWWKEPQDEAHRAAWSVAKSLQENQVGRRDAVIRNMRLYAGSQLDHVGPFSYARSQSAPFRAADRLTMNVVASNIDTLVSKMAKSRPRPRFLTSGGDYTQQRKAKRLQQFIDGLFFKLSVDKLAIDQFRDACWAGTGISYWYRDDSGICAERVFPGEILVDPRESLYASPRQLFRIKYIDRGVLKSLYQEHEEIISEASAADADEYTRSGYDSARDQVKVVIAWHLPSSEDADDGRMIVFVNTGTLQDDKWTRPELPFVNLSWREPVLGYWGIGISDELTGIQIEINKLLRKIQDCFHLLAVPWVLRERGSQVNPQKLINQPGIIIDYTGTPPVVVTHQTVHPEVFQHLDRLIQRSYEITGVSMLSAQSRKPPGIISGRAIQEYHDIESERFMEVGRRYEQMILNYARQSITLAREAAEAGKPIKLNGIDKRNLVQLKWKDVDIDEDAYVMQIFASSSLPQQPAARIDRVLQLMEGQLIDPQMGQKLLDFPDLESYNQLRDAPIEDIEAQIEVLLDGRYEPPEPFQSLDRAVVMVQSAYLRARRQGAPESVLENMRRFMAEVKALKDRIQQEAQKQAMAQQAQAQAEQAAQGQAAPQQMPQQQPAMQ